MTLSVVLTKENLLIETISSIIAEESFRWHVIYGSVAVSKTILHLQGTPRNQL
jgi:hypothetical protein